jgi:protein SCO1
VSVKRHLLAMSVALLVVGTAATVALALRPRSRPEPPRFFAVPAFSLTDRTGHAVSLADLAGRPWIADFIFTRCPGTCPLMTARLARLRGEVPADVRFVSITVDPGHDTREVLDAYARRAGADDRWHFLTGAQADLYRLATGGFKLAAQELTQEEAAQNTDGPFLHSTKFVLVDGRGMIRGYYESADEAALADLVRDVTHVAAQ